MTVAITTAGPIGRAILTVMSAFAQLERDQLIERTEAGMAVARSNGRKAGRRKVSADDDKVAKAKAYHAKGNSVAEIQKLIGASRATVYRYLCMTDASSLDALPAGTPTKVLGMRWLRKFMLIWADEGKRVIRPGEAEGPSAEEADDIEPLPKQYGLGPVGKAIAAGAATGLGSAATAGGALPVAMTIAAAHAATQEIGARMNKIHAEREAELLNQAAATSSLTAKELIRRILEDDELTLLAAEAVDSARRTRVKEKVRALGRSLGAIVADTAQVDEEGIWIRILASMEPPHIRLLAMFLRGATLANGATYWRPGSALTVREAGDSLGLEDAVLPLIQDLVRCGLIMSPGIDGINGGSPSSSPLAADGLNEKMTATWLAPKLLQRLELEL